MSDAFICDVIRTPFGRYGGSLSTVRTAADDVEVATTGADFGAFELHATHVASNPIVATMNM